MQIILEKFVSWHNTQLGKSGDKPLTVDEVEIRPVLDRSVVTAGRCVVLEIWIFDDPSSGLLCGWFDGEILRGVTFMFDGNLSEVYRETK